MNFNALADELDSHIRTGNSALAAQKLKNLGKVKIPRIHRARFGSLFLRTGQGETCLRLLNRIVRSHDQVAVKATPQEKLYYAAGLIACGASLEGINLLSTVDMKGLPETYLYLTIGHFTRWEYAEAISIIHKFIDHPRISEYQKLVGQLNLASALIVVGKLSQAQEHLHAMLTLINGKSEFKLIQGNVCELLAQTEIKNRQFKSADYYIQQARALQSKHSGISSLYLSKWEAVNNSLNPDKRDQGIRELHTVAREAKRLRHWETLRETHFYLAKILEDKYLLQKVYFGTPHPYYRKKMLNDLSSQKLVMPDHFIYHLGGEIDSYPLLFDTLTGKLEGASEGISFASLPHKLLNLLTTDLFRPFRVSKIFAELYPDEFFDPFSSPHRVHEIINRLRNTLIDKNIPLSVLQRGGDYSLTSTDSIALRIYGESARKSRAEMYLKKFLRIWGKSEKFNRNSVANILGLSNRAISRLLKSGLDAGEISCESVGREKYYQAI